MDETDHSKVITQMELSSTNNSSNNNTSNSKQIVSLKNILKKQNKNNINSNQMDIGKIDMIQMSSKSNYIDEVITPLPQLETENDNIPNDKTTKILNDQLLDVNKSKHIRIESTSLTNNIHNEEHTPH